MYEAGGIFSITSQILIVDMLSGVLNPTTVSGLVVLHAERVSATSTEAFILRYWREKNKSGFLKALSDNPEAFTYGFSPLQTMMRNLFLQKPSLYPRFHIDVAKSLEGRRKAEVIELEVPMTESMQAIQNAIMECIEVSLADLKRTTTGLDVEDWNIDSGLHRRFDLIVRRQLDPVWHRTTYRTKQVVWDLQILQNMLGYEFYYDLSIHSDSN
jgi:DNA excision repair protein ERCC-4